MKLSTTVNIYSLVGKTNSPDRMVEAVKVCAEAGFDAVDLYLKHIIELSEHEIDQWIDEMQRAIAETHVTVSQCHLYFGKPDKNEIDLHWKKVAESMAIADRMGIEWGVIHAVDYRGLCGVSTEESIARNVEMFKWLQETVKPGTVGLAFENIMFSDFADPDVLIAICEAANPFGKVGVCWDTGHANLSEGIDQGESIRKLGKWLKCLHIHDNHGQFDEHVFPMMGLINWKPIMGALRDIDYRHDFVYESAQPLKHLPADDVLRKELIRYAVDLGRYMIDKL